MPRLRSNESPSGAFRDLHNHYAEISEMLKDHESVWETPDKLQTT